MKTNDNQENDYINIPSNKIHTFIVNALLTVGVDKEIAQLCATGLVQTSLRGVDTHGIRLLPHYIGGIEGGRINGNPVFTFNKTSPSTGNFDADHTLGYSAGIIAMHHAIDLAKESGAGFVSVKNSSHCGSLAYFGQIACKENMIGLAFTHATSRMKSPGSNREFFGTNPLCFTAPMESEEPFCFDSAPTQIPFHKIIHNRKKNSSLPPACAADEKGYETMDPHKAAQLLPIGIYKGFGWAMMVDILSGLLSGMPVGRDISKMYGDNLSEKRYLGQFFGAIRIDAFQPPEIFKKRLQKLAQEVRDEPLLDENSENMIPGDPEKKIMKERLENGIPLDKIDLQEMNSLAAQFNLEPL
jgi:ureidoglycolate dehydrogenase (NAD+)